MAGHLYFLGIGAQKSATSWLFQCLKEHPELCLAEEKEVHYFSNDAFFERGPAWYESRFAGCGSGTKCGEISTSYLCSQEAPERIRAYAPAVKLIALLRNPVDRAESHMRHLIAKGELPAGMRLEEALTLRPDIYENGLYGAALARYVALFTREQLFVASYDDVSHDPAGTLSRIQDFLGVSRQTPAALRMRYNASAFRASALHDQVNGLYFALRKSGLGRALLALVRRSGLSAARVADVGAALGKGKEAALFTLMPTERAALISRYAADSRDLASWGISFEHHA